MDRRRFISGSALAAAGWFAATRLQAMPWSPDGGRVPLPASSIPASLTFSGNGLWESFRDPSGNYRPFVRWWWNGNRVEAGELIREMHLLKAAGIGGVEINPVAFPSRFDGDDLGKPSLEWPGGEWSNMLNVVFAE
ncbi:MAG TPA: glycoside hydrolase family 2, partial [Bacteroidales bacterium]|nr:glycoside hydrolase family 2 [Bacteroidales bacterium]